jgi:hypothetical protein
MECKMQPGGLSFYTGGKDTRSFVDVLSFALMQKKERKKKSSAKKPLRVFARHAHIRAFGIWIGGSKDTRCWGTQIDRRDGLAG